MAFAAWLAAMVLAACSGSGDGPATTPSPPAPSTVEASAGPTATPEAASPVVVLVHGFSLTDAGYSCAAYWGALEAAFRRWDPGIRFVTVGFDRGDHDCDLSVGSGGPDTPIEDVGRELAASVYRRFSARGVPVALVGHSMGGLVARSALAQAGSKGAPPFLLVPSAVTMSSPHGGADAARSCPDLIECREQIPGSEFLRRLTPEPQGRGGTVWTLFGSAGDRLVPAASAVDMRAAHRFVFERPAYTHVSILLDGSDATDARWRAIRAGSSTVRSGEPHSLRAVFLATR
jgi:pimeloyl-ACP methyl ester carboxylesterase